MNLDAISLVHKCIDDGIRVVLLTRHAGEIDAALQSALHSPEFKSAAVRPLLTIGDRIVLYPYLSKKQAELAPRLAAVLKGMKAEGLLERFRQDAFDK